MKKITLISLSLFLAVVGYIYFSSLIFSPNSRQTIVTVLHPPIITTTVTPPQTDPSGKPTLDQSEIAKHATPNDCYLIIHNNVYDVSSYADSHPGGRRQITSRCGSEVTGIFAQIHSNRAWDLLARYKIGTLAAPTTDTANSIAIDLNTVEAGLKKANPKAEIVNVKPKNDFYIAKVIYDNKLYEVHIDSGGKIIKEEVESDEFDWSLWDTDKDDQ